MPDALALRHALCSGTGRHLLGLPGFFMRQIVSPKSWISGRKLRISNSSSESQKKEKVSPPSVRLITQRPPNPCKILSSIIKIHPILSIAIICFTQYISPLFALQSHPRFGRHAQSFFRPCFPLFQDFSDTPAYYKMEFKKFLPPS